jgi:hypothetical protein
MAKRKRRPSETAELAHIVMSGLRITGVVAIIIFIGLLASAVWQHFTSPAPPAIPTIVEGQHSDYGSVQQINIVLQDGTKIPCFILTDNSDKSISCDWTNATTVPKPS